MVKRPVASRNHMIVIGEGFLPSQALRLSHAKLDIESEDAAGRCCTMDWTLKLSKSKTQWAIKAKDFNCHFGS